MFSSTSLGDPDEVERRARVAVDRGVDVGGGHAQQRRESVDDDRALLERQVGRAELDDERRRRSDTSARPLRS